MSGVMAAKVGWAGIGVGVTAAITFAVGVSVVGGDVSVGTRVTAGVQETKMVARSMMIFWAFTLFASCF